MPNPSLKQVISEQYMKCAMDPVYFMRKYGIIQHPTKGKIYFDLYKFQEKTLESIAENRYNVILKSRQMGISTLVAAYALWCMLFRDDFNILVIATTQDVAKNLVTKVRVMHENLPRWLQGSTAEDNKLSLKFKNGSVIKAVSSASTSGRSEALSLLIVDEAAFIDKIDEIWASAQQTLATGGGAIVLSTPNGTGNFFHKTWVAAQEGKQFNPIRLHWTLHPDRDQRWRDEQTELLGERLAAQECDCDFISSGHTVVAGELVEWYRLTYVENHDPVEKRGPGGDLWIWEYPDYTKNYIVSADVARGDGSDTSAFHVIEIETLHQVAEYKGKIGTTEFGHMLISIATEYNNALLAIETANVGWAVIQVALDRNYPNIFYTYKQDGYVDDNIHLVKGYDLKDKSNMIPGHVTSTRTRPLMIAKLETYFREKTPIVHSSRLLDELMVFIWINDKPQAQRGYNDDLVMAFCIALWVRDTALKLRQQGLDLTMETISRIGKSAPIYQTGDYNSRAQWEMPGPGNTRQSLKWLL